MDGISVTESTKARKAPKVLHHLEIHGSMKSGHIVQAHHSSYQHPPEEKDFAGPHDAVALPKGHILHHVAQHLGIPITEPTKHTGLSHEMIGEEDESRPEPWYEHETRKLK